MTTICHVIRYVRLEMLRSVVIKIETYTRMCHEDLVVSPFNVHFSKLSHDNAFAQKSGEGKELHVIKLSLCLSN
jgi:hypothetical protein